MEEKTLSSFLFHPFSVVFSPMRVFTTSPFHAWRLHVCLKWLPVVFLSLSLLPPSFPVLWVESSSNPTDKRERNKQSFLPVIPMISRSSVFSRNGLTKEQNRNRKSAKMRNNSWYFFSHTRQCFSFWYFSLCSSDCLVCCRSKGGPVMFTLHWTSHFLFYPPISIRVLCLLRLTP